MGFSVSFSPFQESRRAVVGARGCSLSGPRGRGRRRYGLALGRYACQLIRVSVTCFDARENSDTGPDYSTLITHMARALRIGFLLFVLLVVAQGAWIARARTTEWKESLRVVIYPINGDGSAAADAHIQGLRRNLLEPIAAYLRLQARDYNLPLQDPVEIYLAPRVASTPPAPPR